VLDVRNEFADPNGSLLVASGAPVDAFGVGTKLGTGGERVSSRRGVRAQRRRGSAELEAVGKATIPGRKQVYRITENNLGRRDVFPLHDEAHHAGVSCSNA
jgi:nicotinic acid phosphoribosyltransferase